jgi:hypothetical protein
VAGWGSTVGGWAKSGWEFTRIGDVTFQRGHRMGVAGGWVGGSGGWAKSGWEFTRWVSWWPVGGAPWVGGWGSTVGGWAKLRVGGELDLFWREGGLKNKIPILAKTHRFGLCQNSAFHPPILF